LLKSGPEGFFLAEGKLFTDRFVSYLSGNKVIMIKEPIKGIKKPKRKTKKPE
jgi:hypothetical protein